MIRMTWCSRAKQQSAASGRIGIGSRPSPRQLLSVALLGRFGHVFSVHTRAVAAQGEWCEVRRDETSRLRSLPKAETPSQSLLLGRVVEVPNAHSPGGKAIRLWYLDFPWQSRYQRAGTIRSQFPLPISENIFVMTSHYSETGTGTRI